MILDSCLYVASIILAGAFRGIYPPPSSLQGDRPAGPRSMFSLEVRDRIVLGACFTPKLTISAGAPRDVNRPSDPLLSGAYDPLRPPGPATASSFGEIDGRVYYWPASVG